MSWEEDKPKIVSMYHSCIEENNKELFLRLDKHPARSKGIHQLVRFIEDRISAVWFLALNDRLWDADIIDRSVMEVLLKLMYIVTPASDEEQKKRLDEFWNKLWEISLLKHSELSGKLLKSYKDSISQLAHSPLVLSEEEESELRLKWNNKKRKAMEQKWSFSEILLDLIRNYKIQFPEMLLGLAHEYRMCSHVAHGDQTGIDIITERNLRSKEMKEIVHRGHFLKLLSNCLAYSGLSAITAMDYIKEDKTFFFNNFSRIDEIKPIEEKYTIEVFNDPDYEKFKNKKST